VRCESASSASCTRWWRPVWDLDQVATWALNLGLVASLAPEVVSYVPFAEYPPLARGSRRVVAEGVSASEVIGVVREAGGEQLARVEVFDVLSRRAGRSGARIAGAAPRVPRPIARSATRTSRTRGSRSPRRWRRGSGVSCVASAGEVVVVGASGYAGAIAARLLWSHPEFELTAITAREDAGRSLDEIYPHHRVPLVLEEFDIDRLAGADAAIVAYPHGTAAPVVARCSNASCAYSICRRTFACATSRPMSAGMSRIRTPS